MNRIRLVGSPSLPNSGDMIDVDTQQWHKNMAPGRRSYKVRTEKLAAQTR
jgi:hypothetical protein